MTPVSKLITLRNLAKLLSAATLLTAPMLASAQHVLVGNCFGSSVDLYTDRGEFVSNFITSNVTNPLVCVTDVQYGTNSNLFVADYDNRRISEYSPLGGFVRIVANNVDSPVGQLIIGDDIYVASREGNSGGALVKVNITTGTVTNLASVRGAAGVVLAPNGNILVSSGGVGLGQGDDNIQEFTPAGDFVRNFVTSGSGGLSIPQSFQFFNGKLYVISCGTNEVIEYDGMTGDFIRVFANTNLDTPTGLNFNPDGTLLVSNKFQNGIVQFNPDGTFNSIHFGNGGATDNITPFRDPSQVAVPEPGTVAFLASLGIFGSGVGIFHHILRRR